MDITAVNALAKEIDPKYIMHNENYWFRCPVCGDSKKKITKKRGWFLYTALTKSYAFHCYNCGVHMSLKRFCQEFYPQYTSQIFPTFSSASDYFKGTEHNKRETPQQKTKVEMLNNDLAQFKNFIESNKDCVLVPLNEEHKAYLKKRMLPESYIDSCKWCTNGYFKNRIVMPFETNMLGGTKTYYLIGRTLDETNPLKYKNLTAFKTPWGMYNVDDSKPFYVTEGVIDAMLVPNAMAMIGKSDHTLLGDGDVFGCLNRENCYVIQDNDATGKKTALALLRNEMHVFKWREYLMSNRLPANKIKDVSDVYKYINFAESNFRMFFTDQWSSKFMI